MCKCTPSIRTPFCGKEGCTWPSKAKPENARMTTNNEHPDLAIQFNEWPNTKGIGSINAYAEEEYFNDYDVVIYTPKYTLAPLEQRIKELDIDNKLLKERCGPSKVVVIDDGGHYVSQRVYEHIQELQARIAKMVEVAKDGLGEQGWFDEEEALNQIITIGEGE